MGRRRAKVKAPPAPLKLDLGCGGRKQAGFHGVDVRAFPGVDTIWDLTVLPWPWADNSVEELHVSHFVEHLTQSQRINFVNEVYRILTPAGKATIIVPHWASCRAYGDLTHQWPPVSELWFYYLRKSWRADNAPHNDLYTCDFDCTWGYNLRSDISTRSEEFQSFAIQNYKEVAQDIISTWTKRV